MDSRSNSINMLVAAVLLSVQPLFSLLLLLVLSFFFLLLKVCMFWRLMTMLARLFFSIWVTHGSVLSIVFVRPAGQASSVAKTLTLDTTRKHFTEILSYTPRLYKHYWLLPFYATFSNLDLGWGLQGQRKAKPVGFIFSHTLQLVEIEFDVELKQFKLNILMLIFSEIF